MWVKTYPGPAWFPAILAAVICLLGSAATIPRGLERTSVSTIIATDSTIGARKALVRE
jgi:hypothetical protein